MCHIPNLSVYIWETWYLMWSGKTFSILVYITCRNPPFQKYCFLLRGDGVSLVPWPTMRPCGPGHQASDGVHVSPNGVRLLYIAKTKYITKPKWTLSSTISFSCLLVLIHNKETTCWKAFFWSLGEFLPKALENCIYT